MLDCATKVTTIFCSFLTRKSCSRLVIMLINLLVLPHFPSQFHSFPRTFASSLVPSASSHPFVVSHVYPYFSSFQPINELYLQDDGPHVPFIPSLFRPRVYTWTNEETSKESVSFNHAGTGKLNYPDRRRRMKNGDGGWKSGRGTEPMGVGLSSRPYRTGRLMIGYNGAACTTG